MSVAFYPSIFFFLCFFFFFNDTATTEIYTLSLHDALPICTTLPPSSSPGRQCRCPSSARSEEHTSELQSHSFISYAVFCLKKKKNKYTTQTISVNETPFVLRCAHVLS